MKRLHELFAFLMPYKGNLAVNVICNVLNAILSLFTFLSVVPFLRILFGTGNDASTSNEFADTGLERWSNAFDGFVAEVGAETALLWICV